MKILLFLGCLVASVHVTSAQSNDPNAEVKAMGVSQETIDYLCKVAVSGDSKSLWGLPPMIEEILMEEDIYNYKEVTDKAELHQLISTKWEEKYSKVYCEISNSIYGSLDAIALYHENHAWVYMLYNPDGIFKADINRIGYLDFEVNKKGTLLDYLERATSEKHATFKANDNSDFKNTLIGYSDNLKNNYGAKYMRELDYKE